MKEIKRYEVVSVDGVPAHRLSQEGRWVKYDDKEAIVTEKDAHIAALQEQVRALTAENLVIKSSVPSLKDIEFDNENMDDVSLGEDIGFNEAVELMKKRLGQTPATDAALREIRAQVLDDMADNSEADWLDAYIDELRARAARIRSGEQP